MKYLATPEAAEIWAKLGGFGTRQQARPASVYPDPITQATETPLAGASSVAFDMSDDAARLVRRDDRPGRVGDLPEVPPEPIEHLEHPAAARELGSEGVQEREVAE